MKKLPEGKLVVCNNGKGRYKWFRSDGKNKYYIKKEDRKLAEQLAHKKFLTLQLEELTKKKIASEFYLRHYPKEISKSSQLISKSSEYQNLLSQHFTPLNQELNDWMSATYEKNTGYPEKLQVETMTGEFVRSKSEAIIHTQLCMNKIPFRYECVLILDGKVYYPDFTIRHPRTGEIYYWEHLGMMDKYSYIKRNLEKLEAYFVNGIIPTINLILTYETESHPLSVSTVCREIERYFL